MVFSERFFCDFASADFHSSLMPFLLRCHILRENRDRPGLKERRASFGQPLMSFSLEGSVLGHPPGDIL
jgi:hypothetical protein